MKCIAEGSWTYGSYLGCYILWICVIFRITKCRGYGWAWYVARMGEMRNTNIILMLKPFEVSYSTIYE
jgi:hypothetical protein